VNVTLSTTVKGIVWATGGGAGCDSVTVQKVDKSHGGSLGFGVKGLVFREGDLSPASRQGKVGMSVSNVKEWARGQGEGEINVWALKNKVRAHICDTR